MRIATLNVCFGVRSRLAPAAARAAEYSRRLDELDLDVVNLQEVWSPALLARIRAAFHGVLLVRLAGSPVVVGNTHLTANRDGDWSVTNRHHRFQRAQLDLLRAATRSADPAVLTGDFNVTSGCPPYPSIVEGWRDPFAANDPATYQQAMLPPDRPASRIDYLLVRGLLAEVAIRA